MVGKKRKATPMPPRPLKQRHGAALDADPDAVSSKSRSRAPKQHQSEDKMVSSGLSSKILKEALKQREEVLRAFDGGEEQPAPRNLPSTVEYDVDYADDCKTVEDVDAFDGFSETETEYDGGILEIDEEDEKVLSAFMPKDGGPQLTLADLIIQKIQEKDAQVMSEQIPPVELDKTIVELYKGVGKLLSRYTIGKIPKAFKHIPSLECWKQVVALTEPENWSPNAVYQATRIFSSNMTPRKVQRFYEAVLLQRVRHDIRQNKRLHFALYQSLKKALFKPAAFFKGILLPLCRGRDCTLREAVIIGSVISKVTIPPLHSSAVLMKLAEMEYCGTTSYFIKLFLEKKYALPYRVLDSVMAHFMRFINDERTVPVIWHQTLLAFVQRYKNELERKDKDNLARLLQHQKHYLVTPEIRRELKNSRNRGESEVDLMLTTSAAISVISKPIDEDRWDFPEVPMEED